MGGLSGHRRDITPGQARLVTARFVLRRLFFSFLAEVPHCRRNWWECVLFTDFRSGSEIADWDLMD